MNKLSLKKIQDLAQVMLNTGEWYFTTEYNYPACKRITSKYRDCVDKTEYEKFWKNKQRYLTFLSSPRITAWNGMPEMERHSNKGGTLDHIKHYTKSIMFDLRKHDIDVYEHVDYSYSDHPNKDWCWCYNVLFSADESNALLTVIHQVFKALEDFKQYKNEHDVNISMLEHHIEELRKSGIVDGLDNLKIKPKKSEGLLFSDFLKQYESELSKESKDMLLNVSANYKEMTQQQAKENLNL